MATAHSPSSVLRRIVALAAIALFVCGTAADDAWAKRKKKDDIDPVQLQFETSYKSDDAPTRVKAVQELHKAPDELKLSILGEFVVTKETRADVIGHAVGVLESIKDPKVIEQMVKASKKGDPVHRSIYIEAMARLGESPLVHKTVLEALDDKAHFVRGIACYTLGEHRSMDALEPLFARLEDPDWQVQAAALAALPRLSDRAVLKANAHRLVDFMENITGRLRTDVGQSLRRITGKRFKRDVEAWRAFVEGREPPKKADGTAPGGSDRSRYGGEKPHFYGMELHSHRAVLILDMSLSMNEAIEIDTERLRRETTKRVVTGDDTDKKKKDDDNDEFAIPWWRIKTRLDLARYQTINLISRLEDQQMFEVIVFSTKVSPWMGKLVPANTANRMRAIEMIKNLKPDDKTNTWGAIARCFEMSDRQRKGPDLTPDEVFIVTDGAPSVGDIVDPDQILDAALQLWKIKRIRFNAIGIGVKLPFLKKLCNKTGGEARFITD